MALSSRCGQWTLLRWLLLLGLGMSGMSVLLQYRHLLSRRLLSWRVARLVKRCKKRVLVVQSEEAWEELFPYIQKIVGGGEALGLDCEWKEYKGQRRPVALLQLATSCGMCVLLRLQSLTSPLPPSLQSLLQDVNVVKAGVGICQDKKFLERDYDLKVNGCVDLRHLVMCCHESGSTADGGKGLTPKLGLGNLSLRFLGRTLDKAWYIRASDWEAEYLTKRQQNYAAEDALVGVQLLIVVWTDLWCSGKVRRNWWLPWLPPPFFHQHLMASIHNSCHQYMDLKFFHSRSNSYQDKGYAANKHKISAKLENTRAYSLRRSPLYHNCQLLAPDGTPLCTCDPKKAKWYVQKGLGVLVKSDPMVVHLNFEPTSKPRAECEDDQYYVQERLNVCVVCGQEHSYLRKSVVPNEYRKYFPNILKNHVSHDVVLLCINCHRLSNTYDSTMRNMLSRECNAPLDQEEDRKVTVDPLKRAVKNAAGALLRNRSTIPEPRVTELENCVKKYLKVDVLSQETLQDAASIDARNWNENYESHGKRVCDAYQKKGLVHLQQRWREHFLETMQPKHLPQFWSVTHNLKKMYDHMAQLSQDHPDYETYKVMLVGTEGNVGGKHDTIE